MNVTLSIDDDVFARARELANRRGTSVNQILRDYLEALVSEMTSEDVLGELEQLWRTSSGDSAHRAQEPTMESTLRGPAGILALATASLNEIPASDLAQLTRKLEEQG